MYSLINQHAGLLVKKIDQGKDIAPYVWLRDRLHKVNVTEDADFRRTYRNYWRLNAARLSEGYVTEYFRCLEDLKRAPDSATVEFVLNRLDGTPSHRNSRRSTQFSFATKLVHTLRPDLPVYDRMVESFFFLPRTPVGEAHADKFERRMKSYEFLQREYRRIIDEGLLSPAMDLFRQRIALSARYTDVKVIDTLIWKFTDLLNKGAIRDGDVLYG